MEEKTQRRQRMILSKLIRNGEREGYIVTAALGKVAQIFDLILIPREPEKMKGILVLTVQGRLASSQLEKVKDFETGWFKDILIFPKEGPTRRCGFFRFLDRELIQSDGDLAYFMQKTSRNAGKNSQSVDIKRDGSHPVTR